MPLHIYIIYILEIQLLIPLFDSLILFFSFYIFLSFPTLQCDIYNDDDDDDFLLSATYQTTPSMGRLFTRPPHTSPWSAMNASKGCDDDDENGCSIQSLRKHRRQDYHDLDYRPQYHHHLIIYDQFRYGYMIIGEDTRTCGEDRWEYHFDHQRNQIH